MNEERFLLPFLVLWVDDIIIAAHKSAVDMFKRQLLTRFKGRDLAWGRQHSTST